MWWHLWSHQLITLWNLPQTLIWKGNRLARVEFQYLGWLQLALSTIVAHAASFLVWRPISVQWACLVMINVTTSPSITNVTIKCHNKAHSYARAHTHTRERETCCKNWKLDINHKYKLTLTDPQTWHEVYPHHGNKRLCFLQQISTSKRSHILLQRSTIQIVQWAAEINLKWQARSPDQVCLLIAAKQLNSPKWIDD